MVSVRKERLKSGLPTGKTGSSCCIRPRRSATKCGVMASARPSAEGVAAAIDRMYEGDTLERFRQNCAVERRRFSWEEMCSRITELYGLVASGK